jgi:hypothetical protein
MRRINKLGYKISSKTLGRDINLLIDNKSLLDILDDAYSALSNNEKWAEKNDSQVITKELKKSYKTSGDYSILTCAHCKMTEDLLLSSFKITHNGDYIIWTVKPPGADIYFDNFEELEFKFHKPQYQTIVDRLIEDKMIG